MPLQHQGSKRFESYLDIVYRSAGFVPVPVGEAQDHSSCNHPRTYLLRHGLRLHLRHVMPYSASARCLEPYYFDLLGTCVRTILYQCFDLDTGFAVNGTFVSHSLNQVLIDLEVYFKRDSCDPKSLGMLPQELP